MKYFLRLVSILLSVILCAPALLPAGEPEDQPDKPSIIKIRDEEDLISERKVVESQRERRAFRIQLWASRLKGDMRRIYLERGYPSSRYREEVLGRIVEKWTYIDAGLRFTFQGSRLIDERKFAPGTVKGYVSSPFAR